ncbi:BZ3500_MvSof-1268-A1-R1_Chr7-1g09380 [Microbotryum saponariae]|uniref:BZ3500_MvSof-1268-A1-R1_Chr7-1g09380 protein n=1 Tax=Microbotryum saponariae TaxID=289078 RepID=A0A2X0LC92_9BASI|nr:BZ3500_MvSof-1268-A1-R1_Chr7-1g09380 [Microbotryum saponariae]
MSATLDKHAFEKSSDKELSDNDVHVTTTAAPEIYDPSQESIWTRAGLSFRSYTRAPGSTAGLKVHGSAAHIDPLKEGANPMLQQKMKSRHLTMIAVGGSIGTALRNGGPAGILIAWSLIGIMMINVTQCLGELAILYPLSGGFYTLAVRFLDPGFGMALGYNYLFQWAVVLPLEITAAGITVQYWTESVPIAAWITIFWFAIIFVNIFGTLGFAEEEFWSSCLKLTVVVIFVIIGIVLNVGAGPSGGEYTTYLGGDLWRSPGAFANGFKGVCAVFVTAAFSFAGTELVGLAATETPNPRQTMPGAVKGTFWRITVIYLSSLLIIGLNIPYNDERLLGGSGAGTSPFVIMVDRAGIRGLNHLINATICISVLSIGLSCVYAGSRVLTALAETGYAPKVFAYVDRSGRPLWSVLFVLAFGPIAYVNVSSSGDVIFDWLLALSGLSTLFTWGSICLCHIRFRRAWKVQGHSVEELPFKAAGGVYGSWFGLILVILVLIAQFYVAIWPIGGMESDPKAAAETFFKVYLAMPVLLFFWVVAFLWKRTLPQRAHDIDLDTGRKSWLTVEEMRLYREERRNAPFFTRAFRILFSN